MKHKHKCPICKKARFCESHDCEPIDYSWMCDQCWMKQEELEPGIEVEAVNPSVPGRLKPVKLISDRAKRYRAQANVKGPRRCVICGRRGHKLDVMHLDGDESNGDARNLAYGCRSCNAALGAAFKSMGSKNRTVQYNPDRNPPTYDQWKWAVVHHLRGQHDEGGRIIHATPRHLRIEYNREIYEMRKRRGDFEVPF